MNGNVLTKAAVFRRKLKVSVPDPWQFGADPDAEPDPYCDKRIRIRIKEAQKHTDPDPDVDADPEHCIK